MVVAPVLFDGMLSFVGADGTLEYYKDSTGSNSDTDLDLMISILLVPSALIRLLRARHRPGLVEIPIAALAWIMVGSVAPWDNIAQTQEYAYDGWLTVYWAGFWVFGLAFCMAILLGWVKFPDRFRRS